MYAVPGINRHQLRLEIGSSRSFVFPRFSLFFLPLCLLFLLLLDPKKVYPDKSNTSSWSTAKSYVRLIPLNPGHWPHAFKFPECRSRVNERHRDIFAFVLFLRFFRSCVNGALMHIFVTCKQFLVKSQNPILKPHGATFRITYQLVVKVMHWKGKPEPMY